MNPNDWQIESNLKKKYKMLIKKELFKLAQVEELSTTKMCQTKKKNSVLVQIRGYSINNYVLSRECLPKSIIKSIPYQSYLTIHTLFHLCQSYFVLPHIALVSSHTINKMDFYDL